eukprot:SAG22_NODE_136_length_18095_cov_19.897255_21_plen_67_part_00
MSASKPASGDVGAEEERAKERKLACPRACLALPLLDRTSQEPVSCLSRTEVTVTTQVVSQAYMHCH